MNLTCDNGYHNKIAMVGAITLLGCLAGSVFLLPKADHYGRKTMNVLFLFGQAISMVIFLISMTYICSYTLLCFSCFIAGAVSVPLIGIMICYVTELSTLQMMHVCIGASFLAEAVTSILVGLYFNYYKDSFTFYVIVTI